MPDDFIIDISGKKSGRKGKNKRPGHYFRPLHHVQRDLSREFEFRQLVDKIGIGQTGIFRTGFRYFDELDYLVRKDFFLGWIPGKIKKYLRLIIPFLAMLLILRAPISTTPEIRSSLALFACIALMWAMESLSIVVTALMIPVLATFLGLTKNANPFSSFSNPIIYLMLAGLILAQAFKKHEIDKLVAVRVLAASHGNGKRLLLYTMLATALLGMWMSNTATMALMIPVILSISGEIKPGSKNYAGMLLLASGFSSSIGGLATILGGHPNAITAAILNNLFGFSFTDWLAVGLPVSAMLFIIAYLVFVRLYRLNDDKVDISPIQQEATKTRIRYNQSKVIAIFILTLAMWVFGRKIGTYFSLPTEVYSTEIIGLCAAVLLFAFKLLRWEDVRKIRWEIFLLVGGGLALGQILIQTGSASLLAQKLMLVSRLPNSAVITLAVVLAILLSNFVNNSSATVILVPVLIEISGQTGISPSLLAMSVAMATAISPLTPIAMPSFSMIYSTGKVSRSEMIKTGLNISFACGLALTAFMYLKNRF